MKRFLNLAVALGLVIGTANAASAASLGTLYNRYVAPALGTPYVGNTYDPYYYNGYYGGYSNPYSSYVNPYYGYNTSYYGYNPYYSSGYNPYYSNYGYNYNSGSVIRSLGSSLLNWF
jgi:hypothetical protein